MKKILAAMLAAAIALSLTACGSTDSKKNEETEASEAQIVGGYEETSPVVDDELKALFEKANESSDEAEYDPIAVVATQVVAGTNYKVLCTKTDGADSSVSYSLVTLYADLNGNAEISEVLESTAEEQPAGLEGGWNTPDTPEMTDSASEALEKALESFTGAGYTGLALVSTQVVAGTNYCILCEGTTVTASPETYYALVYVYADLQGNAEITDVIRFE